METQQQPPTIADATKLIDISSEAYRAHLIDAKHRGICSRFEKYRRTISTLLISRERLLWKDIVSDSLMRWDSYLSRNKESTTIRIPLCL